MLRALFVGVLVILAGCVSLQDRQNAQLDGTVALVIADGGEYDGRTFCAGYARAPKVIVTARHCIQAPGAFAVKTRAGTVHKVTGTKESATSDVAVVFIETPVEHTLVDTTEFKIGDPVKAVGHPIGRKWYVTTGNITDFLPVFEASVDWEIVRFEAIIVTDVLIAPGNSGGPLFDSMGRVIGVASMMALREPKAMFVAVSEVRKLVGEQ